MDSIDGVVRRAGVGVALMAVMALATAALAQDGPKGFKAALPEGMKADFIVRFDKAVPADRQRAFHFDVDGEGRPFVLVRNTLVAVRAKLDPAADALRVAGVDRIGDAAWMPDGSLVMISGRELGVLAGKGFARFLTLPALGMRIAPASADQCYLYGGDTPEQQSEVYLYRKGGKLLRLIKTESPVTAVAGSGIYTFFSVDTDIFVVSEGSPVRWVYTADEPVTSLAMCPPKGLVYSTASSVGYLNRPGLGFTFVRGKGAEVRVRGAALYLFFADEGVVRMSPARLFEKMVWDYVHERVNLAAVGEAGREALDRGLDAAKRQDWEAAVRAFREAREAAPYAPDVLLNTAVALERAGGREVLAIFQYRAYLAAAPNAPDSPTVRAKIAELSARVQANARRLRSEGVEGFRKLAAESSGSERDNYYSRMADAQIEGGDFAVARGTVTLIADASKRDPVVGRLATAMARRGDYGGAQGVLQMLADRSQGSEATYLIAAQQAKAGSVSAAETALAAAGDANSATWYYSRFAEDLVAMGKLDDAARIAAKVESPEAQQQIYAAIAVRQAEAGDAAAARRTLALVGVRDVPSSVLSLRLATAHAALGEFAEARAQAAKISWDTPTYMYRVLAAKEIATRQAKTDAPAARKFLLDETARAERLDRAYARDYARYTLAMARCAVGDTNGAAETAWLIDNESLRVWVLASVAEARGDMRKAEVESWASMAANYEAYPDVYRVVNDLKGYFEARKNSAPAILYGDLTSAATTLDFALAGDSQREAYWQERRNRAK